MNTIELASGETNRLVFVDAIATRRRLAGKNRDKRNEESSTK